jgi:hypothetical protein
MGRWWGVVAYLLVSLPMLKGTPRKVLGFFPSMKQSDMKTLGLRMYIYIFTHFSVL